MCFALVACGKLGPQEAASGTFASTSGAGDVTVEPLPSDAVEEPFSGVDWDNPIPQGEGVGSISDAQAYLEFSVYQPDSLGEPARILVTGPLDDSSLERAVALIYDHQAFGRVAIVEALAQQTPSDWLTSAQQLVDSIGEPGIYGTAQIVSLNDGSQALLTTSKGGRHSVLDWLEGDVEIFIEGPSLNSEDVQEISGLVVHA